MSDDAVELSEKSFSVEVLVDQDLYWRMGKSYVSRLLLSSRIISWLTYPATVASISALTAVFVFSGNPLSTEMYLWFAIAVFVVTFIQGIAASYGKTQDGSRFYMTPAKYTYRIDDTGLRMLSPSKSEWFNPWDQFVQMESTPVALLLQTTHDVLYLSRAHLNDEVEAYIAEKIEHLKPNLVSPCERIQMA
ncbi:MAG: hypothetical protein KF784_08740 [Fimbriimonadaceae bacterium]|nr:hypothetical protein [Fimbriimonadaceae bacterium]